VLRLMRITLISVAVLLALTVVALLGGVLWQVLGIYIDPQTASERKYLVQSFVIVVAEGTWLLVGAGVVGVLYLSRRKLKHQRELEGQRVLLSALPAYLDQMVRLLNDRDRPLRRSERGAEVSNLAKWHTLRVLPRLDGERKARVLQFLYETGLIIKDRSVVDLLGADLRAADLGGANLRGADLREADLSRADLRGADLRGAHLSGTNLREADLQWADLISADLSGAYVGKTNLSFADLSGANLGNVKELSVWQLEQAYSLEGATMPDGSKHP
jgi:Pentapeptide repeats (8 copies)